MKEMLAMGQKKNKPAIVSMIGCIVIGLVYAVILLKLVVFKNGFTTSFRGLNLIPCQFIVDLISGQMSVSILLKNVLGNIAVFVPMGILLPVIYKKLSIKKTVVIGFFVSLTIELAQFIIGLGICDIDDLITNTIGVLLGALIYEKLTKSWDEHWENSFASFMMLCFIGMSSALLLFFFGYGNHLIETPVVMVNEEVLNGLEKLSSIEIRCENIEDSKIIGYQNMYNEQGFLNGSTEVSYPMNEDSTYYQETITASYSINGNVNKVTTTYQQITKEEFLEIIKRNNVFTEIWTNDANECYAAMATIHER